MQKLLHMQEVSRILYIQGNQNDLSPSVVLAAQHNDHTDGDAWGHVVLFGSLSYLSSLVSLP
jgi:hypothetical protein